MKNKKISIIVPVYNSDKFLNKCLDSILAQSYDNLEIIIVNDGSTDNSANICDEYSKKDNRIKVIHKDNEGVSIARNTALDFTTGDYISLIDSDDYIDNDFYEKLINCLSSNSADIALCKYTLDFENNVVKPEEPGLEFFANEHNIKYLFTDKNKVNAYLCRGLFDANLFKSERYDESIKYMEDLHLFIRLIEKSKKIAVVNEHLYHYYQNPNSATHKLSKDRINNQIFGLKKCIELLESKNQNEYAASLKYEIYIAALYFYIFYGDKKTALDFEEEFNTEENYLAYSNNHEEFKSKIKCFLSHNKLLWLYKLLYKITK